MRRKQLPGGAFFHARLEHRIAPYEHVIQVSLVATNLIFAASRQQLFHDIFMIF